MSEGDIDRMMEELQAEWGRVHVAYRGPGYYDGKECVIRNKTDEGLPVDGERHVVEASTFTEALSKAHTRHVKGD